LHRKWGFFHSIKRIQLNLNISRNSSSGGKMNALSAARKYLRVLLIFSMVLLFPGVAPSQAAPAETTFTVNTNSDYDPGAVNSACSNGAGGTCGLREAIKEANAIPAGYKYIEFSAGMAGQTITLNGTEAWGGSLVISGDRIRLNPLTLSSILTIDAVNLPANSNLFEVQGSYISLVGFKLKGWADTRYPDWPYGHGVRVYDPTGSGGAQRNNINSLKIIDFENDGILVYGSAGGGGNLNNLIGIPDYSYSSCDHGNRGEGIAVANGADNTQISTNTIFCNGKSGIFLDGRPGGQISGTVIYSNWIGTISDLDMGNGLAGIADFQASGTEIDSNVISGNGNDGVWLMGTISATLTANKIGVGYSGNSAVPNDWNGVTISDNAHYTQLGSPTDAADRNTISGNLQCGVAIVSGSSWNTLDGNYIGLGGATGNLTIPNGTAGVCFFDANMGNMLSSYAATVRQFISGNSREGVYTLNSASVFIYPYTSIGVAGDNRTPAGNGLEGIKLDAGTIQSFISPGIVMNNELAGIAIVGDTTVHNGLLPIMIDANGGLPIDLGNDGHTANGSHTPPGPDNWMNYPVVSTIFDGGFTGTTCPGCIVRFYQSTGDPTANGGGGIFLSDVFANGTTGNFSFPFPLGVTAVTMLALNPSGGDTSEFSPSVVNNRSFVFLPLVRK
jgi:Right handed beta helix region